MRESDLLHHVRETAGRLLAGRSDVIIGPGDDCAVVRAPAGLLLLKSDQIVERRHVAAGTSLDLVARKALARTVSDIAAMGGRPLYALVGAALPHNFPQADARLLADRLHHWGLHFGCPVVGGDIATLPGEQDPYVLCISIVGEAHARGPVLRSDARPGDTLCVTGAIGNSLASGRHLTFEPRVHEAEWLAITLGDSLGAMIDISDGLGIDAARVAHASNVRIEIDAQRLPIHPDAGTPERAIGDGEDYELLFTVRAGTLIPPACPTTGTPITTIGRCLNAPPGAWLLRDKTRIDVASRGWEHT